MDAYSRERARLAYFDDRFALRNCDYCGAPYRGPAVYCSLECVLADADMSGAPPRTERIPVLVTPAEGSAIDAWALKHRAHGRSEAIHRMIKQVLAAETDFPVDH